MKTALTTALYSRLSEVDNGLMDMVSGVFDGEAPAGAKDPYITYSIVSYTDISNFGNDMFEILLQFSIFSSDSSSGQIKEIEALLNDDELFRNQRFTFDGGTIIQMVFSQSDGPRKVEEEVQGGLDSYWQTDCDYQIIIEKD